MPVNVCNAFQLIVMASIWVDYNYMCMYKNMSLHIFFGFVTGRKRDNRTKQPHILIPSMAMRKGGAGGGGGGGCGCGRGGGGRGHIFGCASVKISQNHTFLYFLARIGQKSAIFLTLFQEDKFQRHRPKNGRMHGRAPHGPP